MSYVSTVVDFLNTRTTPEVSLTPEDYTAIAEWEKQEIPLDFLQNQLASDFTDQTICSQCPGQIENISSKVILAFFEAESREAAS